MILITGIIVMIIAAALLLLLRYESSIEEENRLLEASIETARMYSEALERRTEKIRRLRHDTVGMLQAIESADGSGRAADIVRDERSKEESTAALPGMPLPDAIVELKMKQCMENDIEFGVRVEGPSGVESIIKKDIFPDETDLSLLLQNMLDNAYEANLRIDKTEGRSRAMSLLIRIYEDRYTVAVSNSLPRGEKPTFSTRKPSPELHGIGMKVIDEIIRKYNGRKTVTMDEEGNKFTIEASLRRLNEE